MSGRPSDMEQEKLDQEIIDVVMSLWKNSDKIINFKQIHQALLKATIVQKENYRYKTNRILKKLIKMKLVEKLGRGRYRSLINSEEFKVFNYLQNMRKKLNVTKSRVGGSLWTMSQQYFLGMSESVWNYEDAKFALDILNVRLAYLFEAYRALATRVNEKDKELQEDKLLILPEYVIRELLLELIPYVLGSKAGIDFDGLPTNELDIILPKIIQSLPEEVTKQNPTRKDMMNKYLEIINTLPLDKEEDNEYERKDSDFALIVTRPEHLIDEKGSEKRCIIQELTDFGKENKSAIYIASSLLNFDKNNVVSIFTTHGNKLLGRQKMKKIKKLYEKISAANQVAKIITQYDHYDEEIKTDAKNYIQKLIDKHGIKTLITNLTFSNSSMRFISPTPRKEQAIRKIFPQLPQKTIHDWLEESVPLAKKISDEKLLDLKKSINNI